MWREILIAMGGAIAASWLALIVSVVAIRPRGSLLSESLRILPDMIRLLKNLTTDSTLTRGVRVRLALLMVYLALPIDLIPDFIPVLGYADDAIVAVLVLRSVVRRVGLEPLRGHWPGTSDGFAALRRLAGLQTKRPSSPTKFSLGIQPRDHDSGPLDRTSPDPHLVSVGWHSEPDPDGSLRPCNRVGLDLLLDTVLPQHPNPHQLRDRRRADRQLPHLLR